MKRLSPALLLASRIVFCLALVLCMFFLFYGISPLSGSFTRGYIGAQLETDAAGHMVLDPTPDREAANAGVETGDILLSINGQPVPASVKDTTDLLNGSVGQAVTLRIQKAGGGEKSYTIVRSGLYQQHLANAGLKPFMLAGYYMVLSLLVGLTFAILSATLLLRREGTGLVMLAGFLLLLFPYSLNAASMAHDGAVFANLDWLYNLLRAAGIFMTFWLLLIFPNGQFIPKWTRWALGLVAVWMLPYTIDLVVPCLPSQLIDIAWMGIIAVGVGVQVYRAVQANQKQTKPVMQAALAALGIYVLVWVISRFIITAFSNPVQIWFSLIAELLVDAALLFFGFRLARSLQKGR